MSDQHAEKTAKIRPLWQRLGSWFLYGLVGGVFGYVVIGRLLDKGILTYDWLGFLDDGGNLGQAFALAVAGIYLLISLLGLGACFIPKFGITVLEAEDEKDWRNECAVLLPSALSGLAVAAILGGAGLAGPGGWLSAPVALAVIAAGLVVAAVTFLKVARRQDELMHGVTRETGEMSFYLTTGLLGGWAILAHLGIVAVPSMLAILTWPFVILIGASLWVSARRGMLQDAPAQI